MKMDKYTEAVICHEWGHALLGYFLFGSRSVESIEFRDNFLNLYGHTNMIYNNEPTEENQVLLLYGGITAENICGYSRVLMHKGTDADKICLLIPDKRQRSETGDIARNMLAPYKDSLEWLTKTTIEHYPKERDENGCIYYRIFHDELVQWVEDAVNRKVTF